MKKISYIVVIIFLMLITVSVYAVKKEVKLIKCVDGDTARFSLNSKEIKARFLGIDTPESVHPTKSAQVYGKEASTYTCNKLEKAKKIYIEYDSKSAKTDKYDRHLVWVFVDDVFLQEDLISKGYAKVAYLYGKYDHIDELKEVEEKAKSKKLRIWSDEAQKELNAENSKTTKKSSKKDKEENNSFLSIITSFFEIINKLIESIEKLVDAMV